MTALFGINRARRFSLALTMAASLAATVSVAMAQDATYPATVNGVPITEADLAIAAAEFADQINQVAPGQRRAALVDLVINIRLASKAAEAAGLDKDELVAKRLELVRERTLYSEYLRKQFITAVTEDAARKVFAAELAKFVPADQFKASHILVKTEDEAKDVIKQLDAGGDFAAIAKEKSIDTGSATRGGDLGFFGKGAMVKPFEDAALATPVGTYTKTPVQSDFGWHVILVTETRKEPPPTFESQAQRIQEQLIRETFQKQIDTLRTTAKIDVAPAPAAGTVPAAPAVAPADPMAPAPAPAQ